MGLQLGKFLVRAVGFLTYLKQSSIAGRTEKNGVKGSAKTPVHQPFSVTGGTG